MKALLENPAILKVLPFKRKSDNKVDDSKLVSVHHDVECSRLIREKANNLDFTNISGTVYIHFRLMNQSLLWK